MNESKPDCDWNDSTPFQSSSSQPIHTDHPARHWDRTCPACIAEGQNNAAGQNAAVGTQQATVQGNEEIRPVSDEAHRLAAPSEKPQQGTPRTDALQTDWHSHGTRKMMIDIFEFARQLERELAEARTHLDVFIGGDVIDQGIPTQPASAPLSARGALPGLTPSDGLEKELYETAAKAIQGWCDGLSLPLVQIVDDHTQAIMDALAVLASPRLETAPSGTAKVPERKP